MIRLFVVGLISLSLTACLGRSNPPVEYRAPPADVPDAALVADCDTSNNPTPTNGAMSDELVRNRGQRDDCADRMKGVQQWRSDAIKRAEKPKPKD